MTPYSGLAERLARSLSDVGYRPLDELSGRIGGDRHGIFDYTWIAWHQDGRHCLASLFIRPEPDGRFPAAEVWAGVEEGTGSPRSLVLQVRQVPRDLDVDLETRIRIALLEAVRRAETLRTGVERDKKAAVRRERQASGIERAPYRVTVSAVRAVFDVDPEREWRNSEVLAALLEREFQTDRAAVNAALAELAGRGVIERIRRGRYRSGLEG